MKFGKVEDPAIYEIHLPNDHPQTAKVVAERATGDPMAIHVGFPTWSKAKLPGFYPRGTKKELQYYSSQLNSIEFNASFYRIFSTEQFEKWRDATPDDFRFYPKMVQNISHWRKLKDCGSLVQEYVHSVSRLENKLGTVFLQMQETFSPHNMNDLAHFLAQWPKGFPLAVELRHEQWHSDTTVSNELNQLLIEHGTDHIITDALGRRDMVHMRLTTARAFIRFAAADHPSDRQRLDDWVRRIQHWKELGVIEVAFFIHQNTENENPMLASYFTEKLNATLGCRLQIPASF